MFYLLSMITGILECGWIAFGLVRGLALWQILCYPLSYHFGNLFPKPFSLPKNVLFLFCSVSMIVAVVLSAIPVPEAVSAFLERQAEFTGCALPENVERGGFDLCVCNPPYWGTDRFEDDGARTWKYFNWEDLFGAAARSLRSRGRLCVIVPAEKTDEVLARAFGRDFALKRVQAVHAHKNAFAKRVLMELVYQGRPGGVRVMPPVITDTGKDKK